VAVERSVLTSKSAGGYFKVRYELPPPGRPIDISRVPLAKVYSSMSGCSPAPQLTSTESTVSCALPSVSPVNGELLRISHSRVAVGSAGFVVSIV
jgi:hypothetical protein